MAMNQFVRINVHRAKYSHESPLFAAGNLFGWGCVGGADVGAATKLHRQCGNKFA